MSTVVDDKMNTAISLAKVLSITCFFYYGISCIFARGMETEFARFGLTRFRKLTGALEVMGAVGLSIGYLYPPIDIAAAAGLSLLMLMGVAARIRVRDRVLEMLPATLLLAVNIFILLAQLSALAKSPPA